MPRLLALCSHDPAAGVAAKVAAIAGIDDDRNTVISWVPGDHIAAAPWRTRLRESSMPLADTIEWWADRANGISFDVLDMPAPDAVDLAGAVEAAIDEFLAHQPES